MHVVRGFAARLLDVVDAARDRPALGAVEQGGFLGDLALLVGFEGGEVEGAPAERLAGLDDFVKAFAFAFAQADGFLGAQVGAHDFEQGVAAAADLGDQPLADDPAQRIGQPGADLLLLLGFEHAEDAVDGLAGVDRVQRAQHQVAGLRGAQGDLDRLAVAHFADENDFGRLAQGGAQAVGEAVEISAQFALVERGHVVRMNKFDRVFQRDDVNGLGVVDLVEDGGQRGGFAGAGRAGDQHQAGFFARNLLDDLREVQRFQRRDDGVQLAAERWSNCRAARRC